MDQNEFRSLKESGGLVDDAGLQEETVITDDWDEEEEHQQQDEQEQQEQDATEEDADDSQDEEEEDLPPLNEKEKTAFEKRMERERAKERERIQAEYEEKYGRHRQIIDLLGGDPEAIEKRIRDNQIAQEAQRLAEANGWDEEQTSWYVEQQKQQRELKELRVQMQINRLKDNPDYAGIASLEKEIMSKIDKTGGALSVEEAYWALGGHKRAEQIRLEAQMRESEKRKKQPRTVITDAPITTTGEKPLPPEVAQEAQRMGISAAEARRLMSAEPAGNIDEWRARKQKAK